MQILMSPTHPTNRKVLRDTYGIVTADDSSTTAKRGTQVDITVILTQWPATEWLLYYQQSTHRKIGAISGHLTLLPTPNRKSSTVSFIMMLDV